MKSFAWNLIVLTLFFCCAAVILWNLPLSSLNAPFIEGWINSPGAGSDNEVSIYSIFKSWVSPAFSITDLDFETLYDNVTGFFDGVLNGIASLPAALGSILSGIFGPVFGFLESFLG